MNFLKTVSTPFWFITLSIVFGFTLPILIQDAMFQDAMLYSSVSHNLGIGYGTFWFPQYSTLNLEGISSFHEQLPLVFGIQSIFYKLLGDSIYVERFYTLLMILLHIVLINTLWKEVFKNNIKYINMGWLPVLFWILIPVCFWSFRGNMLENTVSLFALVSVIISYKLVKASTSKWYLWLLSGFFIFLASFSKGIPGFFPLSFPFLYWLITKNIIFRQCLVYTLLLISVPALIYFAFYLHPVSNESLGIYFVERLLRRINSMHTADSRFETPWRLFQELIPHLIILTLTYFATKKDKVKYFFKENFKESSFFFAIGLSAILPLMLTMVQKGWYMVPGFPYLAIGFALITAPSISSAIDRINQNGKNFKVFQWFSVVLLLGCLGFTLLQKNKINRHEKMVTDVYKIGEVVPNFSTLTVPDEMYNQYDFVLQSFFVRYFNISISPHEEYRFFLKEKGKNFTTPNGYTKVKLGLDLYELYEKKVK